MGIYTRSLFLMHTESRDSNKHKPKNEKSYSRKGYHFIAKNPYKKGFFILGQFSWLGYGTCI